jgi:hypothetical protein
MMNTKYIKNILAGVSITIITHAADPLTLQHHTPTEIQVLEKLQPEVRSLGQSLSVLQDHLKIDHISILSSDTELSYRAITNAINVILAHALDYALDLEKAKYLRGIHLVSGKPVDYNAKESAFNSLLEMLKLIRDIQDRLVETFGSDNNDESVRLRRQLDGAVKFDMLIQNQTSFSQSELLAIDFLRDRVRNSKSSTSSSSESESSSSRSSTPPKPQSEPSSPHISTNSIHRLRANSSLPTLSSYVDPSALNNSPLFNKKRANTSTNSNKPE